MQQLDDDLRRKIEEAVDASFPTGALRSAHIEDVEIDEDEEEIRFVIRLETDAEPEVIGRAYYEMTDRVRQALGTAWSDYFPILRPRIERVAA